MLGFISIGLLWRALGYTAIIGIVAFLYRLYQVRMMVRRVKKSEGVYLLPHSFLFGHLLVIAKVCIKNKMPADVHGQAVPMLLAKEYPEVMKAGVVYMDVWPVSMPLLTAFHPDIMAQFTQDSSQLKHPQMIAEFMPFTGSTDLVNSEGQEWKTARGIFNPGFAAKNLLSLVPAFVEEALVFRDKLKILAGVGETFKLETLTTNLTVDIIGRAVLGKRLHSQERPVKFMRAMLNQVGLLTFDLDLSKQLNPLQPFLHWANNRIFRNEIMPYVLETVQNYEKIEGPKTILNLALKSYVAEVQDVAARGNIPSEFLERVVNHIKMFIFAGHDTTATTLTYAYYELSKNPNKAAIVRAEHDSILGTDPSKAAERITRDPTLLNQMPYTLAVVKETLRLWPVVGTVRIGAKSFFLRQPETGFQYPAERFILFGCSQAVQRNPNFWPQPDSFIPERFTVRDEKDPLHPVKNAFRPWEMGPRNCIGQELASLELRLILALTVREFDMEVCYREDAPTFLGNKAYQVQGKEMITAHPKDGMPVKVLKRM